METENIVVSCDDTGGLELITGLTKKYHKDKSYKIIF